jgi:hypothetical protein
VQHQRCRTLAQAIAHSSQALEHMRTHFTSRLAGVGAPPTPYELAERVIAQQPAANRPID